MSGINWNEYENLTSIKISKVPSYPELWRVCIEWLRFRTKEGYRDFIQIQTLDITIKPAYIQDTSNFNSTAYSGRYKQIRTLFQFTKSIKPRHYEVI